MNKKETEISQKDLVTQTFEDNAQDYFGWYIRDTSGAHSFNIRRKRVYEYLDNMEGGKLLDIGCGPGVMVKYAINHSFEFYGIDVAKNMIDQCSEMFEDIKSAHFFVGEIEKIQYPENFFDVVTAMGVVEYIDDDIIAIKEMYRVVKPGGIIIITLPNKRSPYRIWDRIIYRKLKNLVKKIVRRNNKEIVIHREYNEKKYCNLLQQNSLKIIDVVYYNFKILLSPLDKLFPSLTIATSKILEFLCRSRFKWLGTGFIVKCQKQ